MVDVKDIHYNQIQTAGGSGHKLNFYEKNEIINPEVIEFLNKTESETVKQLMNKKEIKCLFGEKKVFISLQLNQYHYLDIGHLENFSFISD